MSQCCNSYGQCTQGADCAARECRQSTGRDIESERWKFTGEHLPPPDTEVRDMAFYFVGFVLFIGALWAVVSVIAGLLERI